MIIVTLSAKWNLEIRQTPIPNFPLLRGKESIDVDSIYLVK